MKGGPTNRVEMIAVAKSVERHLNMVAAMRLEITAKSGCLHRAHLLLVTAAKR